MKDNYTLELNSPITEEQWDMISDVDFDRTEHITFYTKNGKEVHFYKDAIPISWIEEWLKKMPKHTTPYFYKRYGEVYKAVVLNIVKDWRKENETN